MTGLNQAKLRKNLAKIHLEENENDMGIANTVIVVSSVGSFVSLLASLFFPWVVFVFAGFLATTSYSLFLKTNIQEDLEAARKRYKNSCDRLEELEREASRG